MTERDFEDRLLPSGRLREPLSSLQRADAIVLPAASSELLPDAASRGSLGVLPQKPIWRIKRELALPHRPSQPIAFCGLARPEQFFAQLRAAGITPAAEVDFRDHHAYNRADIERLLAMRVKFHADAFLTTEKDAMNLGSMQADLQPMTIATLNVTLDRPADAVDAILTRIAEREPRS